MDIEVRPVLAVSTKFQAPSYDDGLVSRDRLIDQLREGRAKRLTLIHAPAGFGKTTLAVQWQRVLRAEGVPVAWLSLDRDDNDAVWFLSHLVEAVRRVEPTFAGGLVDVLEQHSGDAQRYVLTELVNQVAEHRRPLAIVLDDWHLIDNPKAAAALEFLLDVGPDNLHLIVTSRTRSPAVGRLRVRNQVTEIDATQLRFDRNESAAFLLDLNALDLDSEDVHQLCSSTDGWVAALQLATLSLRNSDDPSALIRGFSGRHHSIGDYLAENVLNTLPADLLDFLLTTSICDRLCGDLAAAVSGQRRGQALLEELEQRDMFLRPLDDNREWFRYHHLFADYLRRRLERTHADRIITLHRTASAWFADHDLLGEAVTHALAAGNDTGAVDLVERQAMPLVEHSRMATLLGLVNKLPQTLLPGRPGLQIAIAWANCLLQRAQPAQTALDHVRATLASVTDDTSKEILGEADVVQACIDVYGDRIDRAAVLVAPYIAENPSYRPWPVAVSSNIRTFVDIHTFAYDTAQKRQQWANAFHEATHGPFAAVYGRCFAGLAAFAQLDLVTAGRLYKEAVALARGGAGRKSHAARLAGALLGRLYYERGDIDAAERLLEECHELGAESGVADFMIATYSTLARIKVLRGDVEDVWSFLDEGNEAASQLALPRLSAAVDHERLRLHLALGDIRSAQNVLARQSEDIARGDDGIAMATRRYQLAMRARIMSAQGDYEGALRLLSEILHESSSVGWRYAETTARVELAVVLSLGGDSDAAIRTAVPALVAGARSGLVRTMIDAGPELLKIIREFRGASQCRRWPADLPAIPSDYLSKLLATAHIDAERAAIPIIDRPAERNPTPEEPLNAREIDILCLLNRGLSNKEIARSLNLTINTVKWYLKNIYTKLGVARRGESVAEARRRGILA
ncbi:LuxR C-terminal-related transcriptional regulator [Frankia sp. Mgl5]|uniref:LuxR C-terminal-related transcriptional regulator n=1 Tax=Frankia sp. Mgl5 TaxID=2933793 RepID=UPI00200CD914|nr:LuxR C-terminal-related transcriptional regulator [Frankia sp. Mgl5]MCK9930693.1 LuxR C-terminal-related transcriptional regulator [Frankia sp. Mgl5]